MNARKMLVCFDLGGVLVRICHTWEEACAHAGLPVRDPGKLLSNDWIGRRRAVIDRYQVGELSCEQYYREMSLAVDEYYSPEEVRCIHAAWTREEYPGIEALIDALEMSGVPTACLSNTNHAHWLRLTGQMNTLEYPNISRLHRKLASHLLKLSKPDPRIYERARAELGAEPEQIVFFDDLSNNVAAARAAGWNAFKIDPAGDPAHLMQTTLRHLSVL